MWSAKVRATQMCHESLWCPLQTPEDPQLIHAWHCRGNCKESDTGCFFLAFTCPAFQPRAVPWAMTSTGGLQKSPLPSSFLLGLPEEYIRRPEERGAKVFIALLPLPHHWELIVLPCCRGQLQSAPLPPSHPLWAPRPSFSRSLHCEVSLAFLLIWHWIDPCSFPKIRPTDL